MLIRMRHLRRTFRHCALSVLCLLATGTAHAVESPYPQGPIKLVVAFAAGGGTDHIARVVAQALADRLGQPVIVDNRPGAGGTLGTTSAASAPADGYTLLLGGNGTMVLNPILYPQLKYQVERDFVAVAGVTTMPYLIAVNPKLSVTDLRSLFELGQKQKLSYASPGNGTTNHLVGVLLQNLARVEMIHVPYRGTAPAMNDVVSGQVNFLSGDFSTLQPMVTAGKLRPIAVTGSHRVALLPQVATVAESGFPGFDATGWFALFAPKGTPPAIVEKLAHATTSMQSDTRVVARLKELGGVSLPLGPRALSDMVRAETQRWRKVIVDNRVSGEAVQ